MTTPRTPVVLLHALATDASMWDAQRRALESHGHPVLAPHQRGFGGIPLGDAPPLLDVVADDLARQLDERGIHRAVLAGSSMGGYVAMTFLRRHPGRTLGLALLSARAGADSAEARAEREKFASALADPALAPGVIAATAPLLVGATTRSRRPAALDRVRALAAAAPAASLAWSQRAVAARPDSSDVLRATDVPAVVVAGDEDGLITLDESRGTALLLPRGRLVTLPGAGHLQPMETPEAVTDILTELLAAVGAAAPVHPSHPHRARS